MRFAAYTPNFGPSRDTNALIELGLKAEEHGWDGFFVWDHLQAWRPPVSDPWVVLSAVAAQTSRIALGPMIVPVARRRPQKLALEAASLQKLSGGRTILGVGMGVANDFTLFGEEGHWRARSEKLEENLALMQKAWRGEEVADGIRYLDEPVEIPVWASGEWPRQHAFHGVGAASGLMPISRRRGDEQFHLLSPTDVVVCRASLPANAQRDFAMWSWGDDGSVPLDEYEAAGVTWWLVELLGLELDEVARVVEAGPHRYIRPS